MKRVRYTKFNGDLSSGFGLDDLMQALSDFLLDTLMRIPGVSRVQSIVCLDEIKGTTAMPLEA